MSRRLALQPHCDHQLLSVSGRQVGRRELLLTSLLIADQIVREAGLGFTRSNG